MVEKKKLSFEKSTSKKKGTRPKVRKRAAKESQNIKSYEPPTRPFSKMQARKGFLSTLLREKPVVVQWLFDGCYPAFLNLTKYPINPSKNNQELTEASVFWFGGDEFRESQSMDYLTSKEEQLAYKRAIEGQAEAVKDVEKRLAAARELHAALDGWRNKCRMKGGGTDWFCDFGAMVMRRYWEDQPKPVALYVTVLAKLNQSQAAEPDRNDLNSGSYGQAWQGSLIEMEREYLKRLLPPERERQNLFSAEREIRQIQEPMPPIGLPAIADERWGGKVLQFEDYQVLVRRSLLEAIAECPLRYLPDVSRARLVKRALDACFSELVSYWEIYGRHLKGHGWKAVIEKKEIEKHCLWLLLNMDGKTHGAIAQRQGIRRSNVTDRINEIKDLLGLARGRVL